MNRFVKPRVVQLGKFYPPQRGGMESHLKSLCDALRERVDFTVLVANDRRRTAQEYVDGIRVVRLATLGKLASVPVCPSLINWVRRVSADIIHIHVPNPTGILAYLVAGQDKRLILTYHSDTVRQRVLAKAVEPMLERAMQRAESIICTSPNYIDSSPLLSRYRAKCRVIPFGVSLEGLQHRDQDAAVARINTLYGSRVILAVGRLVYYKGFEHLIRAMRNVHAHLLIIGEGPLHDSLVTIARSCGAADKVTFLGNVEDIAPYYHAADIFVLPSVARSEAFGIVQLEAMACGKPVVNTALASGVPFVSVDGVTGITVPPADSGALAVALNLLLENAELRARLGKAGKQRVESVFNLPEMARRTFDLYQETPTTPLRSWLGNVIVDSRAVTEPRA